MAEQQSKDVRVSEWSEWSEGRECLHQSVTQAGRQAGRQSTRRETTKQKQSKAKQSAGGGGGAESVQTPHHPSSTALVRVDVHPARPITIAIAIVIVSIIGKAGRKR